MATLLLLVSCGHFSVGTANAFELFGFKFFESSDDEAPDIIDPVRYEVTLKIAGEAPDLTEAVEANSLLIRQQKAPASGTIGLLSLARDDHARLVATLFETARYGGVVDITVAGRPLHSIGSTETVGKGDTPVPVVIRIDPGNVFTFGKVAIAGGNGRVDHGAVASRVGLVPGEVGRSTIVLDAENALVAAWGEVGHPYPKIAGRQVIADHETNTVDVTLKVDPGPEAVFGTVTLKGAEQIDPDFLIRHADIPVGSPFDTRQLERARRNLRRLEALGGILIRPAKRLEPGGRVPITIEISERKRHIIGGGVIFSSTEGVEVQGYWKHRNFLNQGETLGLEAAIGRIFEADDLENLDARAAIGFHKPGVFSPHTDLDLKTGFIQEDPDPYHREAFFLQSLVSERWTDQLTLSAGAELDLSWIDDAFGSEYYTLLGVPLTAEYDTRDDPLDATRGMFARLYGEPFVDAESGAVFFKSDAELRYYYSVDDDGRLVIATRGLIGTLAGASLVDIPAHRRFYAGGAGSVRGYDLYDIGPQIFGFGATGGRSKVEGSLEARFRATDSIGLVAFLDAGLVSSKPTFAGTDEFQAGAGAGLRYFTPVGPLRLDVAFPINPRQGDPDVAFYLGIGQAF